jgi:cell fate (sporulation/competence/biofilm development) regulator YlbF (YheA/YmcA/DUF963 family)
MELAARLGKLIAGSPQAVNLRAARDALDAEPEIVKTLEEYREQTIKIAALEEEQKPVEVQDKHRLQELNDQLISSAVFKRYQAAQVEYLDLMRRVDDALQQELEETEE